MQGNYSEKEENLSQTIPAVKEMQVVLAAVLERFM